MRGVVSLAAALALPLTKRDDPPFPGRDLILFLTFIVILATLVMQGLSLPPLIRWLGVKDDGAMEKEERIALLKANQVALAPGLTPRAVLEAVAGVQTLDVEVPKTDGRSFPSVFGRKFVSSQSAASLSRNTNSSLSGRRIRNGATFASCAGILAGRRVTLPTSRRRTRTSTPRL